MKFKWQALYWIGMFIAIPTTFGLLAYNFIPESKTEEAPTHRVLLKLPPEQWPPLATERINEDTIKRDISLPLFGKAGVINHHEQSTASEKYLPFHELEDTLEVLIDSLEVRTDMRKVAEILKVDLEQKGIIHVSTKYITIEFKEDSKLLFLPDSLRLAVYSNEFSTLLAVPSHLTHDDAISESQSLEQVKALLDALEINTIDSERTVHLRDIIEDPPNHPNRVEKSLLGASWEIIYYFPINDFSTSASVYLSVSAHTGEIISFHWSPMVVPETINIVIDENDAKDAVARYAKNNDLSIGIPIVSRKEIVGVPPKAVYYLNAEYVDEQHADGFGINNYYYPIRFFVDCATGEVEEDPMRCRCGGIDDASQREAFGIGKAQK